MTQSECIHSGCILSHKRYLISREKLISDFASSWWIISENHYFWPSGENWTLKTITDSEKNNNKNNRLFIWLQWYWWQTICTQNVMVLGQLRAELAHGNWQRDTDFRFGITVMNNIKFVSFMILSKFEQTLMVYKSYFRS